MKTTTVTCLSSYLEEACSKKFNAFVFRGSHDVDGKDLLTGIGQVSKLQNQTRDRFIKTERHWFESFRVGGERITRGNPDLWDWVVLAHQHGLPVRLLEWSTNPLVALFFAVRENTKAKSVVYAEHFANRIDTKTQQDPFAIKKSGMFEASNPSPRIASQGSIFSIHPDPRKPHHSTTLHRFEISPKLAPSLRTQLRRCGIHPATVFPDLHGLAECIQLND